MSSVWMRTEALALWNSHSIHIRKHYPGDGYMPAHWAAGSRDVRWTDRRDHIHARVWFASGWHWELWNGWHSGADEGSAKSEHAARACVMRRVRGLIAERMKRYPTPAELLTDGWEVAP